MQLKEEYREYDRLREEHDRQIVQIAVEANLHLCPDQWSSLLYADQNHRAHMARVCESVAQQPISVAAPVPSSLHVCIAQLMDMLLDQRDDDIANILTPMQCLQHIQDELREGGKVSRQNVCAEIEIYFLDDTNNLWQYCYEAVASLQAILHIYFASQNR
jgi:hypothetical protein